LLGLLPVIALSTCSSNHIDLQSHTNLVPGNKKTKIKTENKRLKTETHEQWKNQVTKDVTSFFFLFTPKPVISSHVSFCDKLRPSAADLHATGFPRECVGLERSALASFKNCSELRVQPTPDSFYVTGCLFRVHLWSSLLYSLLLYSHTHTLGIEPVTGF
jgi:hypothetical protein